MTEDDFKEKRRGVPVTFVLPQFQEIDVRFECKDFAEKSGVSGDIVEQLASDEDWSIFIKIAAMVDRILLELICWRTHLEMESYGSALRKHFLGLTLREKRKLCLDLGLIAKNEDRVINLIAETRNRYAHNVEEFSKAQIDLGRVSKVSSIGMVKMSGGELVGEDQLSEREREHVVGRMNLLYWFVSFLAFKWSVVGGRSKALNSVLVDFDGAH